MTSTIPIKYGEFYDYPRMIRFELAGVWYYLQSAFDDGLDDYRDTYEVYVLPIRCENDFEEHRRYWMEVDAALLLGTIAVDAIGLDQSLRKTISKSIMEEWLATHRQENH